MNNQQNNDILQVHRSKVYVSSGGTQHLTKNLQLEIELPKQYNLSSSTNILDDKKQVEQYKAVLGKFPTGVTVISTSFEEQLYGFTANSFTSVSLEPYLVSFCLNKKSGCAIGFSASEYFAISILASEQRDISHNFASHKSDKFVNIRYSLSREVKCPIIDGCLSYLECKKTAVIDCGDHYIFIGSVLDFAICDDKKLPLVYFAKSYRNIE